MTRDVIEQVALVSGRILHRGTGRPIDGAVTIDAAEGPVQLKVLTDGTFALSADPHAFLAQITANSIPLTLRAQSRTFTQGVVTETIALTAVPPFPDEQADWKIPSGATAIAANLKRTIRGRVIEAEDPSPAIRRRDRRDPARGCSDRAGRDGCGRPIFVRRRRRRGARRDPRRESGLRHSETAVVDRFHAGIA